MNKKAQNQSKLENRPYFRPLYDVLAGKYGADSFPVQGLKFMARHVSRMKIGEIEPLLDRIMDGPLDEDIHGNVYSIESGYEEGLIFWNMMLATILLDRINKAEEDNRERRRKSWPKAERLGGLMALHMTRLVLRLFRIHLSRLPESERPAAKAAFVAGLTEPEPVPVPVSPGLGSRLARRKVSA